MITMRIERLIRADGYTLGRLSTTLNTFWTMEDKVREVPGEPVESWKIPGVTAIPVGTYDLIVTMSNRFKKPLPLLVDVPGFSGVRIHAGNDASNTEGCVLIGLGVNDQQNFITNSRAAMVRLMDELDNIMDAGIPVRIEIV